MTGSFRLARIAGIEIEIHWSWLIIFVLLTVSLAANWFPVVAPFNGIWTYWVAGVIGALLLFATVLAHELGHSLVARRRGLPVRNIELHFFGGVSNLTQEPHSAGEEFIVAFIGPLVSLLIAGIFWGITKGLGAGHSLASATTGYIALANLLLAVFNLLPAFPLDGGRVLRAVIWATTGSLRRATRWAALVGQVLAYGFVLWGIWLFFTGRGLTGIWVGFIGLFLVNSAQSASRQLQMESFFRGVQVRDAMVPAAPSISAGLSLQQLMDQYVLPYGWRAFPVEQLGELVGLATLSDARQIPREQWSTTPVSYILIPLGRVHTASPNEDLIDVLHRMADADINQMLVIDHGRPVGFLSREALLRFLQLRRELKLPHPERELMPFTHLPRAS